ncbi:uncharacterized protein LOC120339471 isoform X1 [Styela clava]
MDSLYDLPPTIEMEQRVATEESHRRAPARMDSFISDVEVKAKTDKLSYCLLVSIILLIVACTSAVGYSVYMMFQMQNNLDELAVELNTTRAYVARNSEVNITYPVLNFTATANITELQTQFTQLNGTVVSLISEMTALLDEKMNAINANLVEIRNNTKTCNSTGSDPMGSTTAEPFSTTISSMNNTT